MWSSMGLKPLVSTGITVKLVLCEPDIIFQPSVETEIVGNFQDQITDLLDDIFHMATLVPRVAPGNDNNNYQG